MHRRLVPALITTLATLSLVGTSVMVALGFSRELRQAKAEIHDLGARLAESASHELLVREMSLRGMQLMGQRLLASRVAERPDPLGLLRRLPGKDAYTYDPPPGAGAKDVGNITGYGPPPAADSGAADEMRMALSLTPLFRTLVDRNPDTPWVYYTSLSGFMYLYPRVEPDAFLMSPEILELEFVKRAKPDLDPLRSVVWTSVYEDAAGKGLMVTVTAPIYRGDAMRGAVSSDISVGELGWILRLVAIPHSTISLVDAKGKEIHTTRAPPPEKAAGESRPRAPTAGGYGWHSVFPLQVSGWSIVVVTDARAVEAETLVDTLPLASLIVALAGILILILALTRSLRRVESLSTTDHLTGLLNRRMFELQAAQEYARARRGSGGFGLGIFDIDDFKAFNDSNGHQEGDRALREVARAAAASLLRATDRVFRIGGEEFAVLAAADSGEQFQATMAKVASAVAALDIPHPLGTHGKLTVSMGGTFVECGRCVDVEEAYRVADAALYRAKAAGKNRVVYEGPGSASVASSEELAGA